MNRRHLLIGAGAVLLFLHRGPGMPEFFLNTTHPMGLEQDFTVVRWDQRGAGLSYSLYTPPQSMTVAGLTARIHALDLPVYFFTGLYDHTANHDLSFAFFNQITAPVKGFYTFANSAHSPLFEQPQRARPILLQDVINRANCLADGLQADLDRVGSGMQPNAIPN